MPHINGLLRFHFKATGNNVILLLSFRFVLRLRYDFIEVRDGTSESADVLGRHCSNIAPAPIISSGSSLQIRFVSDYAHQGAGFSLRYEIFKTGEERLAMSFTQHLVVG